MLAFNLAGLLALYALLRLQDMLPLNPQGMAAMPPDLALNTAVSFTTTTNWQSYGGESTLGYFAQMAGLFVQNFLSAATGIALAVATIRGFARRTAECLGNFWADMTRGVLYILLPIALIFAVFLVWQGVPREPVALCRGDDARRWPADRRARAGRLAGGDQDARRQWRRLLQRQCRAPL